MSDPITDELHAATGIPYERMCHHQTRVLCSGCPDEGICQIHEKSKGEAHSFMVLTYKGTIVASMNTMFLPKELQEAIKRDEEIELEMEIVKT